MVIIFAHCRHRIRCYRGSRRRRTYGNLRDPGILVINAVIGTVQEKKAQSSLEALNKMSSPQTKVLRDGQVFADSEIVPGDIVILDTGDIVPADIRLIEAVNLKIQESALDRGISPGGKNRHHPGRNGYSFGRPG